MAQPIKRFKAGPCTASIFEQQLISGNAKSALRTVSLQRVYRDKQATWQYTTSLKMDDLPKAILVLNRAYRYLVCGDPNGAVSERP